MDIPRGEHLGRLQAEIPKQSSLSVALLDPELRILWVNETLSELCGIRAEACAGRGLAETLPGLDVARVEPMLRNVLATGERVVDVERHGPFLRDAQVNRVWSCSGFRLEDESGAVAGVALVASDVTKRSQDRERLAVLNAASEKIGSTLDISRTAEETLDVLIPGSATAVISTFFPMSWTAGRSPTSNAVPRICACRSSPIDGCRVVRRPRSWRRARSPS